MLIQFPFETTIAGVSFNNTDGTSRQDYVKRLIKDERVYLVDAASAEYPEAIAVYNVCNEQLGFLPSDIAKQVRVREIPIDKLVAIVKHVGRASQYSPYGAIICVGRDLQSTRDKVNDIHKSIDVGSIYNHTYTSPYITSNTSFTQPQPSKQKKRIGPGLLIIICIIVVLAPIIGFAVYTAKTFSFLFK